MEGLPAFERPGAAFRAVGLQNRDGRAESMSNTT
jgi:hypothetical protein